MARKIDFVLVGGGLASANCARWLRESGADGSVAVVGREPDRPYNRPECSKGYLRGEESRDEPMFRPTPWWDEQNIEVITGTSVVGIDPSARRLSLSTGDDVEFDKALLATGANVRRLDVDGCHLDSVFYLRTLGNADAIRDGVADAEHVVLVGGSFIACEVAASLAAMGKRCSLIMLEKVALEERVGAHAGRFVQDLLESHGVTLYGGDGLARFEGDGRVERVVSTQGITLDAQAAVIGVGVVPELTLARRAGIEIGEHGGVRCDARLESSSEGIFAAGDICEYESVLHGGARLRIEHWDVAFNQGRAVALNMLGAGEPYRTVPYFYSVLSDWGELESVGPIMKWDEEIVRGSYEDASFTTWYLQEGVVTAALTWGRSDDLDAARKLIENPRPLDAAERNALGDLDSDLSEVAGPAVG